MTNDPWRCVHAMVRGGDVNHRVQRRETSISYLEHRHLMQRSPGPRFPLQRRLAFPALPGSGSPLVKRIDAPSESSAALAGCRRQVDVDRPCHRWFSTINCRRVEPEVAPEVKAISRPISTPSIAPIL
jgi:hypothetical protein